MNIYLNHILKIPFSGEPIQSNDTFTVIVTIKFDENGNQKWVKEFLRASLEYAIPLYSKIDKESNVVVCGYYGAGDNYITIKYDKKGNLKWSNVYYGTGGLNIINDMFIDDSLSVYIAGRTFTSRWNDVLIIKYNVHGDTTWVRLYDDGIGESDEAKSIKVDIQGNVYLTGRTFNFSTGDDYLTLKYNINGELMWSPKIYITYDKYCLRYCFG